jgi:hypothetical protein
VLPTTESSAWLRLFFLFSLSMSLRDQQEKDLWTFFPNSAFFWVATISVLGLLLCDRRHGQASRPLGFFLDAMCARSQGSIAEASPRARVATNRRLSVSLFVFSLLSVVCGSSRQDATQKKKGAADIEEKEAIPCAHSRQGRDDKKKKR